MTWKFSYYEVGKPLDWEKLEADFDWFRDMREVPQDPIWHAEGNVWIHTKMVVEALIALPEFQDLEEEEKHILVVSALLHDVEKRSTTTTEEIEGKTRIVAPKHAKKGEFTTRTLFYKEIITAFEVREQIAKLVRWHGKPLWAIQAEDSRKEVIATSLVVNTKFVAILAKADVLGRICEDAEELLLRIALFEELCKEHDCWGKPYEFASDYGRFLYLNKPEIAPDYEPYEDLEFTVYCMSALPGAGKDFYVEQKFDLPILSLDDIRRKHKIDPKDKRKQGFVIQLGKEKAKEFLRKKQSFVFNATNINTDRRSKWISLFLEYKARVKIVYLEVPYQTLLKQNRNREYQVPESVIEKMIRQLEIPTFKEAHEIEYIIA